MVIRWACEEQGYSRRHSTNSLIVIVTIVLAVVAVTVVVVLVIPTAPD